MRIEKASKEAVKYACLKFHYAKVVPAQYIGYSVFNDKDEWCGVITYSGGACSSLGDKFGLVYGQYLELTRMALNGKQEQTSKALSISIKQIKKDCPTIKLLVSYADKGQNHLGTIYQATNWIYIEENESSGTDYFYNGKWRHDRTLNTKFKGDNRKQLKSMPSRKRAGKIKYIYPLTKEMIKLTENMKLPYKKKENASIV
jgi:hypothetical protein